MTHREPAGAEGLTLADWKQIDAACDRFEAAWRGDDPPDLAPFLAEASGTVRARLFRELLTLDLEFRLGRGEAPDAPAYNARFPEHPGIIDEVFARLGLAIDTDANRTVVARSSASPASLGDAPRETPRVEGYEFLRELGRGSQGVVYLARKLNMRGRPCALKLIQADPEALARLRGEFETLARLKHLDIVPINHVGEADGLLYLELDYLSGGSLANVLNGIPQPPAEAARLVEFLARAVAAAHHQGIIHRALNPSNILLDADGHPKVANFGLSEAPGLPSYLAPEQAEGHSGRVGPTTDVYGLGAILYELLTGRPPFQAATPAETLRQVKTSDPIPPSRFVMDLPRAVETICLKCLEKRPAQRYATAETLAEDLRRFRAGTPILARRASLGQRAALWSRRRPASAVGLAAILLAIGLLIGGLLHANARRRAEVLAAEASLRATQAQRDLALKALANRLATLPQGPGRPLDPVLADLDAIARSAEAAPDDLSRAAAHEKVGSIYRAIGRPDEARRQWESARRVAEALARANPHDSAIAGCLCQTYSGLGVLDLSAGRPDTARDHFRRVVALSEIIVSSDSKSDPSRRRLLEAYLQIEQVSGGDRAEAEAWFRKTRDRAEGWAAETPGDTQARSLLAWTYRRLAALRQRDHNPEAARALLREAERLSTAQVDADPGNVPARLDLVETLSDCAALERDDLQFERAADLFRRALDHLLRLERDGGSETAHRERIETLRHALAECETASVAFGDLVRSRPARESCRLLALRVRILAEKGRKAEVVTLVEALCAVEANDPDDLYELARSLASCLNHLDGAPPPLRQRCADRAVAVLALASEHGFDDVQRLRTDEALKPLHAHAGYRALVDRLVRREPNPPGGD